MSTTFPDPFFGLFVFKESFFVFLSVLASKFCSSVCCFPQPPPPFLSKDSVGTQSVLLENSSYLKWMTQFPPPRPNYMFSVHNSLLLIIFGAMRLRGVFHRHSPSRDICHYRGQGRRWLTKTLTIVQRNWVGRLLRGVPETRCFPSFLHKVVFDTHSVVINVLLFSECLLLVVNWHTLKERMTMYLYGHFWSISINIFKQNEIAWLFIRCPLVCLNLQNYPYRWQIVNTMQNHSPGSRPISVFSWHSPSLEMFKVF